MVNHPIHSRTHLRAHEVPHGAHDLRPEEEGEDVDEKLWNGDDDDDKDAQNKVG